MSIPLRLLTSTFVILNGAAGEFKLAEITSQGGAFFDYDQDGDLDVYPVQGALLGKTMANAVFPWQASTPPGDRLYRKDLVVNADGSRQPRFTDVTDQSKIKALGYGMG